MLLLLNLYPGTAAAAPVCSCKVSFLVAPSNPNNLPYTFNFFLLLLILHFFWCTFSVLLRVDLFHVDCVLYRHTRDLNNYFASARARWIHFQNMNFFSSSAVESREFLFLYYCSTAHSQLRRDTSDERVLLASFLFHDVDLFQNNTQHSNGHSLLSTTKNGTFPSVAGACRTSQRTAAYDRGFTQYPDIRVPLWLFGAIFS